SVCLKMFYCALSRLSGTRGGVNDFKFARQRMNKNTTMRARTPRVSFGAVGPGGNRNENT
ncbi:MAG: hypothetical protein VW547_11790, partial [Alphaproteobacteria bacterium]